MLTTCDILSYPVSYSVKTVTNQTFMMTCNVLPYNMELYQLNYHKILIMLMILFVSSSIIEYYALCME